MSILIQYPFLAAAIGIVLFAVGRHRRRGVAVGAGIVWLLYGLYELGMKQRWLCSGECNIRVDLLLIYPILLIGLLAAVVSLTRASTRPRS
jgi:formate hydrogenlyase subunit 3/multisubunit Na+/H+ antiporter MnhD subunit